MVITFKMEKNYKLICRNLLIVAVRRVWQRITGHYFARPICCKKHHWLKRDEAAKPLG
jgi:hypothetical protein